MTSNLLRLFVSLCIFGNAHAGTQLITYPFQAFSDGYPVALLKLALSKSAAEHQYQLAESGLDIQQGRALMLLSKDVEIDVAWSMTSNEREQYLKAIKIPIYKGLFGYRLLLIKNTRQSDFPPGLSFTTLQQERIAIQGHDWPDTQILEHNQLNIMGVERYTAMFDLLAKERADYFPRSILEIWRETIKYRAFNVAVEKNIAFHYPSYVFFFVHPNNHDLANAIEQGLLISIQDGSFDFLFNAIEAGAINKANLPNRTLFKLENPFVDSSEVYAWPELSY